MKKRIMSMLLALCMILSMAPMPVHVHAAEETAGAAPVCDCGTDDPAIHATTCAVYVAPENPQCFCAEKCTEANIWCDVCGVDYTACGGGAEEAASFVTNPTGKGWIPYTGSDQVLINATPADTGYKWGYFAYGYSGDPMFILPEEWEPPARTEVDQYYVHCIHIPDTLTGFQELMDYCGKNKVTLTVYIYPAVTTAPVGATGLTANGSAQTLISAEGVPAGGYGPDMLYSVTSGSATSPGSFSTALPTATAAGTYKVWYKAKAQSATTWGNKRLNIEAPNSAAKYITVTIGAGVTSEITWIVEGETYATTSQTAGQKLTLPATPTKASSDCVSYTFDGWFTAEWGGEQVTAETVYSANTGTTYYGRLRKVYTHDPALASYSANGFCPNGCYAPATDSNGDGIYEIANGGQLFWFADQINSGVLSRNTGAVLTADIHLENREWTTICPTGLYYDTTTYSDTGYTGTFDGQGHTISNYTVKGISGTKCAVGLFGTLSGKVQNLGVTNMTFQLNGATDVRAAAIAGQMLPGSTISNCYVTHSTLAPKNYIVGGIAACNYGGMIFKCFTYRVTVDAHSRCGNLVSDCRGDLGDEDRVGTVMNCWTDAARVTGTQVSAKTLHIFGAYANAADALVSGEVAWSLNNSSSEGIWKQNLGTDATPSFTGAPVYKVTNCKNATVYSNTNEAVGHRYENGTCTVCGAACPGHSYENGICTVCGAACSHSYENGKCTVCGAACSHSYENGTCTICGVVCPGHSYENGFCKYCDEYMPAVEKNGVYEISNAGQLYWFAGLVNGTLADIPQNNAANAVLTADITVNEDLFSKITIADDRTATINEGQRVREWIPIGAWGDNYSPQVIKVIFEGTFDGQGHTVSGLYFNNAAISQISLVGDLGGVVKNVNTAGCYFYGNNNVGGVVGYMEEGALVEYCENLSSLASGAGARIGGVVGTMEANYIADDVYATVRYCVNHADVIGNSHVGGLVGYMNDSYICGSYNEGNVRAFDSGAAGLVGYTKNYSEIMCSYNNGKVEAETNAYALLNAEERGSTLDGCYNNADVCPAELTQADFVYIYSCSSLSSAQFASGEVAWRLQLCLVEQIWGQNIDNGNTVQTAPVLKGAKVYQVSNCKNEVAYSNTDENIGHQWENGICTVCGAACPGHSYENGFCTACGGYEPAVYNEEKGVYEISNAGQLYWYAQKLNTENAEIYAELTADIVIPENAPNWEPINASYAFFNGNYHTISGLKCVGGEMTYVGLFGREGWWYEISNLHIEDSYFEGNGYVGALVACMTNGGSVTNCYVTDTTVKGGNDTGGLVGYLGNSGMYNCYSAAAVEGENAHTLVGYHNSYATVENCYYLSETETDDGGRTAAQFASGEVAYLLQGEQETQVWGQNIGAEDYPVFGGRKVLFDQEANRYYNKADTLGDLDLDGDVDAYDLTLLARHVGGIEPVTGQALLNADVDNNGSVDAYDLTRHARYVGGIITSWDQD